MCSLVFCLPIGPKVVPFLGFIFRILQGNPKKELLWDFGAYG